MPDMLEAELLKDPKTPITQILAMTDQDARTEALQKRHESERQQLKLDPNAFSEKDIEHITDSRLDALLAENKINEKQYLDEIVKRKKIAEPYLNENEFRKSSTADFSMIKRAYHRQKAINQALDLVQQGKRLTDAQKKLLEQESQGNDEPGSFQATIKPMYAEAIAAANKIPATYSSTMYVDPQPAHHAESTISDDSSNRLVEMRKWLDAHDGRLWPSVNIKEVRIDREKTRAALDKYVPPFSPRYQEALMYLDAHPHANAFNVSVDSRGFVSIGEFTTAPQEYSLSIERGKQSRSQAEAWIRANVPVDAQEGALREISDPNVSEFSVGRDEQGRVRIRAFQTPNPWTNIKKEAQQSVTQSIRHEIGKGGNRLINPDYSHNEVIAQYKLVRAALPGDSGFKQALDKTDSVVSAVLTSTGLAAEATNLLVNAVRGALLEAPELRYKVAALVPDDLVRQTYVAAVRTAGNTIREFIHKKYHLPDRPKKTPVMVNTLDQIKPEHYRAQDAQKVGITMRDLTRENAIKFIHENVPIEKQESAIETIGRLQGNQFGVSIMDSGWVRIDASAREPRTYDNRPRYGSYNATDATKMP